MAQQISRDCFILIQDLKAHCQMVLEIGKRFYSTKDLRKHESSLGHKHAVTILTQPGHIDEQLKERLKTSELKTKCFKSGLKSLVTSCLSQDFSITVLP